MLNSSDDETDNPFAWVIVLYYPNGKHRRRVYLSLQSAVAAEQRAKANGQQVTMELCVLYAVGGASC